MSTEAVAETDASGNYSHVFSVPLVTYGKTTHQAEAPMVGGGRAGFLWSRVVVWAARPFVPAGTAPTSSEREGQGRSTHEVSGRFPGKPATGRGRLSEVRRTL